jgi:hypothetical protein
MDRGHPLMSAGTFALAFPCAALLLLAAGPARAAGWPGDRDTAMPCRPTISCTAELASPGTLELEAGYIYRRLAGGTAERNTPFLLKLTVLPWLQVQVGSNGYTVSQGAAPARFFDNVIGALKFHVFDQKGLRPALALSGAVSLPTAAGQEGYVRYYDATFTGHLSKDFGRVHADLNGGLNVLRLEDHPLYQGFGALAVSMSLIAPFGVAAEGYLFTDAAPVASRDTGILFAITHSPRKWLVFDIGVDEGLAPARAYSVFTGVTVIPAVLWR